MTKEEKSMRLLELAVNTHTAYRTAALASSKPYSKSPNPGEEIEALFDKFEALFDKKLSE